MDPFDAGAGGILRQPKAVWATAGASVVAFMGIGSSTRSCPSIAKGLDASAGRVSLLFTSYFLITALAMLVTGFVSSRIGGRARPCCWAWPSSWSSRASRVPPTRSGSSSATGPAGASGTRCSSRRHSRSSSARRPAAARDVLLYESAPRPRHGLRPLAGRAARRRQLALPLLRHGVPHGDRLPVHHGVPEGTAEAGRGTSLDPLKALGHGGLASAAVSAFFYNYTFFTVLAFTPFVLNMTPYKSGAVFFAWGVLLAVFSVLVAPRMQKRFGSLKVLGGSLVLLAADVLVLGYGDHTTAIVCTILSGAFIGVNNTVYTEAGPRGVGRAASGGEARATTSCAGSRRRPPLLRAEDRGVDRRPHPLRRGGGHRRAGRGRGPRTAPRADPRRGGTGAEARDRGRGHGLRRLRAGRRTN